MTRKIIALAMSMVLAFSFVSCRGDEVQKIGSGKKEEPQYGGRLKLACVSIDTMNPIITEHASISDFLSLIYEGLFVVKEDLTVQGVLAKDYTVSENNTLYTIQLRDNVKFHNGKIFTADDVVSTLNYMALHSTRYSDFMQYIAGYAANDYTTLVIRLNTPKSDFVNNLDFPILPTGLMSGDFEKSNSAFVPNGTGMYEYSHTIAYKNIILKANDDWHSGIDRAYIDEVDVEILSDEETICSAFDAGAIDALSTSWRGFGEINLTSSLFNTFENEQNRFTYLGLNCQSFYFNTAQKRASLKKHIDNEKLAEDILLGHGIPANSPVRDGVYYNTDDGEQKVSPDIQRGEGGAMVRLLYNSDSRLKSRLASFIKRQLEVGGYTLILDGQPYDSYRAKLTAGDYELYIGEVQLGRSADMSFMFSAPYGGICNLDDEELRTLVSNLDLCISKEDKIKAWNIFEKYYANETVQIPLYFTNRASFVNKRISGKLKPNLSVPYYGLDDMFIKNS